MKAGQTIAVIGAGIIVYSLLRKSAGLGSLNFFPGGVVGITWENSSPVLTIKLVAQNTSNQAFTLKSLAGSVFANEYLVGNVSSFTLVTLQPNAETILYIKIRLALLGIVNDIIRAVTTGSIRQELEFESMANIDNLQIPIEFKFTVG